MADYADASHTSGEGFGAGDPDRRRNAGDGRLHADTQDQSDKRFAGIPVLMHSSLSSSSNQQLGKSVGVDEYVPKFEPQKLAQTLTRLLA